MPRIKSLNFVDVKIFPVIVRGAHLINFKGGLDRSGTDY